MIVDRVPSRSSRISSRLTVFESDESPIIEDQHIDPLKPRQDGRERMRRPFLQLDLEFG